MGIPSAVAEHLSKIRKALAEDDYTPISSEANPEPGELDAPNADPAVDRVDAYLATITDSLVDEYDVGDEEAFDFVLSVADELAALGEMPEMPGDDAPGNEQAEWLGVATTMGFHRVVLDIAAESAAEE